MYFVLVKIVSGPVPDLLAGRLLSVAAGTLTIPLLYLLLVRMAGPKLALASCLVLATSPLHIWFSQEARPYSLSTLLVCASYLALVAFWRTEHRRWAILYGLIVALALYTEYSAVYALVPQILLLMMMVRSQGRRAIPVLIAGGCACLAFLPWLPQLLTYAGPTSEQGQFALSSSKVINVILSTSGVAGYNDYFLGSKLTPWELWPALDLVFAAAIIVAPATGVVALARRSAGLVLVVLSLSAGIIATAVAISLVYPGITYRTVFYASLGWVALCGAALVGRPLWPPLALAGRLAAVLLIAASLATLDAIYTGAFMQQFRLLAGDTAAAARLGWPVMTYPVVTATLIDLYQPHALADHLEVGRRGHLPANLRRGERLPPALWYAYAMGQFFDRSVQELHALGYRPLLQTSYTGPLFLDLWVQPAARLGRQLPINGGFGGSRCHPGCGRPSGRGGQSSPGAGLCQGRRPTR